jgi:hypothetical protein
MLLIKRSLGLAILLALSTITALGQTSSNATGTISEASSSCTATSCVRIKLGPGGSATVVQVKNMGTGTLQFEATSEVVTSSLPITSLTFVPITGYPLPSGSGATSATANGVWQFSTGGLTYLQVRASTLSSGTPTVSIITTSGNYTPSAILSGNFNIETTGLAQEAGGNLEAAKENLDTIAGAVSGGHFQLDLTRVLGSTHSASNPVYVSPATSAVFGASQAGTWTVQPGNTANTTPWLVNTASGVFPATQSGNWSVRLQDGAGNALTSAARGSERPLSVQVVDGSGTQITEFGSGTVTANQGGTWTVQPGNTANTTPWLVTGTGGTFPATQSGNWSFRAQDGSGNALTSATRGLERALSVQIVDGSGNQVTSFGGMGGTSSSVGSTFPSSATAIGFSDGTNMQGARAFDVDSGVGTQYVVGINLRSTGNGGSAELGVAANPLQVSLANSGSNTNPFLVSQSGNWSVRLQDGSGTTLNSTSNALHVNVQNASIPVTAASLPLPTGAATAAKQPALGTAGTASADVLTIQGVTNMTPVTVQAQTEDAHEGSPATNPPVPIAGLDGSGNVSIPRLDANHRITVSATPATADAQEGSAPTNPPIPIAGLDGSGNVSIPRLDANRRITVSTTPATADAQEGSAPTNPPVPIAGIDGSGNISIPRLDGSHNLYANVTTLPSLPTGANVIGNVGINGSLPSGTNTIGSVSLGTSASATGAATCYLTSAASNNSTSCKGSAGNTYVIHVTNTTDTNYFLKMYDTASAPTCSSATGFIETIPALANGENGRTMPFGQAFSNGIGFCLTGGGSSTDDTAAATGVYITILYR